MLKEKSGINKVRKLHPVGTLNIHKIPYVEIHRTTDDFSFGKIITGDLKAFSSACSFSC